MIDSSAVLGLITALFSSLIGAAIAFWIAKRNAKTQATAYVVENQRIVAEARASLIDQINDELVKVYLFELKIRRVFLTMSAAAYTADWAEMQGVLTEISNTLGDPGTPPRIVNGRAADLDL